MSITFPAADTVRLPFEFAQFRQRHEVESCNGGTAKRLLIDIQLLAPALGARAAEMEAARHIPHDVIDVLKSIGVFRLFVPKCHGGLELDLPSGLAIVRALARIDGSLGWTAMIANGAGLATALLPRDVHDRVYRHGPDTVIAGSIQPVGTAERTDCGWRVSGRWPFASGCLHADWMAGFCFLNEDGKRLTGADGKTPLLRGFFMPASDWQIEDTWHVVGLRATASNHIAMKDKFVPAEHFVDLEKGTPCHAGPLYQTVLEVLPLFHEAFAVGLARGALDEVIEFAGSGYQQQRTTAPMRASEIFQAELGRIAADLRAAEAFQQAAAAGHWRCAQAGTAKGVAMLAEAGQAAAWINSTSVRIVDACFALAGGSAVYETSPLQRRLRDAHAAAQHAAVHPRHYIGAGRLLLDASTNTESSKVKS
jgi:alkylation response protein AidB-like acyl-CoA dehydrogenase